MSAGISMISWDPYINNIWRNSCLCFTSSRLQSKYSYEFIRVSLLVKFGSGILDVAKNATEKKFDNALGFIGSILDISSSNNAAKPKKNLLGKDL